MAAPLSSSTRGKRAGGTVLRMESVSHDVIAANVSAKHTITSGRSSVNPHTRRPVSPRPCTIAIPPKLVFNLISDKELKKKMTALGLPTEGKKQARVYVCGNQHVSFCVSFQCVLSKSFWWMWVPKQA
jgi:hypothetical protein